METSAKMPNPLGEVLRDLLKQRNMKAVELGVKIGVSPTSISKILTGVTRPRQNTFTRMCQELCETKEDERRLVSAFTGTELFREEDPATYHAKPQDLDAKEKEILRLRAEQFLEMKAQSIAFKKSVARELDKIGVKYTQDYCEGIYVTDFLIEKDGKRIAMECKFNVQRDFEKAVMIASLIKEKFNCNEAYIVTPYQSELSMISRNDRGVSEVWVLQLKDLHEFL